MDEDLIRQLKLISELRERTLMLIHKDVNEDYVERILKPMEEILKENGVNLQDYDV